MGRFLFYLGLLLFFLAGLVCIFFIDFDTKDTKLADNTSSADYNYLIVKDNLDIFSILSRIASICGESDKECVAIKSYKYVSENFLLIEGQKSVNSVEKTLNIKEGSAASLSVLLASFLANAGIDTYIESNKPCVYAHGLSVLKMHEMITLDLRSKPLARRDITMRNGQIWAVDLTQKNVESASFNIVVTAMKPFDLLMFPDKDEADAYISKASGKIIESCSRRNVSSIDMPCTTSNRAIVLIKSLDDENILSGAVYKGGFLISDLKEVDLNGKKYMPLDVTLKGDLRYPGIMNNAE